MTFDDHVRAALDELPPNLAAALRNVAVVVEDENPDDPDLFGLYHGVPLPERGDMAGMPPDTISILRLLCLAKSSIAICAAITEPGP